MLPCYDIWSSFTHLLRLLHPLLDLFLYRMFAFVHCHPTFHSTTLGVALRHLLIVLTVRLSSTFLVGTTVKTVTFKAYHHLHPTACMRFSHTPLLLPSYYTSFRSCCVKLSLDTLNRWQLHMCHQRVCVVPVCCLIALTLSSIAVP